MIVPTSYRIEEVENLKKCNELKNKLLSIIKTDEDKADFIKYLFKRNSEESIYNTLLNCVNYWKYVKDSVIKSPELEPDYVNMLFNNFVALDYVVLEYEELKKVVKFDQDFIYDLYNKLDILN